MSVPWQYSLLMFVAVVLCGILVSRRQKQLGLSPRQKTGLVLGAFCGAMIGSKVPFALGDWNGLISGSAWFAHGKTILAGLVGGYLGVEVAKWSLDIRLKTGDSFAAPVALAVALGRLACFQAGCCFGRPSNLPWAIVFPAAGGELVPRHPTQLYESIFHFLMAATLWMLERKKRFQGQLIKLYILAYLGFRFLTEYLRPEPLVFGDLTAYQWACLGLVPVFVALWWRDARGVKPLDNEY